MTLVANAKSAAVDRTCVVGLGSEFGDDRLGWCVIDGLRTIFGEQNDHPLELLKLATAADLIGAIERTTRLIVIDACRGLGEPGETLYLVWPAPQIAQIRHPFGHNLTLHDVLELAARIGHMPRRCEVWCVEGRAFEFGQPLSWEIESAAVKMTTECASRLTSRNGHA